MLSFARTCLAHLLLVAVGTVAAGAPIVLDPTFGVGGKVTTPFPGGGVALRALAIQPDGRIVGVGQAGGGFAIARYLSNGSLDPTFGAGGTVGTTIGPVGDDAASAVAIQTDGRIVTAGSSNFGGQGPNVVFALVRYLSDGALDPSFGNGGIVTTDFAFQGQDAARAVVLQPDGKILAGGVADFGLSPQSQFALARYNADGSLDATFGSGGMLQVDMPGIQDSLTGLALQPDGRIVTCGLSLDASLLNRFVLGRLLSDGTLDASFGSGGQVVTYVGPAGSGCFEVRLQGDGRIAAIGTADAPAPIYGDFAVARYLADGSLDPSFGIGGWVTTRMPGGSSANDGVVLSNGEILAAGFSFNAGVTDFALAGYQSDGLPDSDLGPDGWLLTDLGGSDGAAAMAVQADGRIVLGGQGGPPGQYGFALARYVNRLDPASAVPTLEMTAMALMAIALAGVGLVALRRELG